MNNHEEHSVPNACWRCSLDLSKCDCVVSMPTPVKSAPAERNLSFQTRRAIKAEDALNVAQNLLNELLNYATCEGGSSFRPHFDRIVKEARAAAPQPKEPATYTPPKIIDPDAPHPCFN